MNKTEVYSWRLDPDLKQRLEEAARHEKMSVGGLLDRMARDWLGSERRDKGKEALQRRLRAAAEKVIGTAPLGEGPYTRDRIRERVGARLKAKRKHWHRNAPASPD